ncbi:MAG: histidine phosphatase family protein [Mangrovibacterium sp.]|jgi:phosphohistidine phosphatase
MKRIVIVRHAKAVPYGYDDDLNRKLRRQGKEDAKIVSMALKEDRIIPDLIISSPAKRAFKTATIFAETLRYPVSRIMVEDELYEGLTTQDFIEIIRNLPEDMQTVFVFGHNPSLYYLVNNLVKLFNSDMPTCSTVGIDFSVDNWKEVSAREGKLAFQFMPRLYK